MKRMLKISEICDDRITFEDKLLDMAKRYPNNSKVGRNFGMTFVYDLNLFCDIESGFMKIIVMAVDAQYYDNQHVSEYHSEIYAFPAESYIFHAFFQFYLTLCDRKTIFMIF